MNLWKSQPELDHERTAFSVTFPSPLPPEQIASFFRALHATMPTALFEVAVPKRTVVFEAWAGNEGISYRLLVPWQLADQVTGELRHLVPGTVVVPDKDRPRLHWDDAVQVGLTNPTRTINAYDPEVIAADLLSGLGHALSGDETALIQWVMTPAAPTPLPHDEAATTGSLFGSLTGKAASQTELADRRTKLSSARFLAVGRIAARAKSKGRAQHLVDTLLKSLRTASGAAGFTATNIDSSPVTMAATPWRFPAVFNLSELTAISGFPLGTPAVPGLARQGARHFYAPESVARTGRVMGVSNHPEQTGRRIAQSYELKALSHAVYIGKTGHGKTNALANAAAQDMRAGFGVVVVDASNSNSAETLFNRLVELVPAERIKDTIVMDVARDLERVVALNLLDQSQPRMVIAILTALMDTLYSDTRGIWTPQLIYNGMEALIDYGHSTLIDLMRLIRPTSEELQWYRAVKKSIRNPGVREFFDEWDAMKPDERAKRSQPLWDRLWQLNNRPEIHDILGQSHSSFQLRDVLSENKILLINLAGLPDDTSALLATLFTRALWIEAQALEPDKPNFVYLDELQQMTRVNIGINDMLARGRKHKLFFTLSTQYLKGPAISEETRVAIVNHAATKVLFTSSASEAAFWLPEFGRGRVNESDITELRKYDAIARIAGEGSISEAVSFTAMPPIQPVDGTARLVRDHSSAAYGRDREAIQDDIKARRMVAPDEKPPADLWRKKVG